jgi:hypothetical protein
MGSTCDCKYGATGVPSWHMGENQGSENTGCPEIRLVRLLISNLSDTEYKALVKKSGGILD